MEISLLLDKTMEHNCKSFTHLLQY